MIDDPGVAFSSGAIGPDIAVAAMSVKPRRRVEMIGDHAPIDVQRDRLA